MLELILYLIAHLNNQSAGSMHVAQRRNGDLVSFFEDRDEVYLVFSEERITAYVPRTNTYEPRRITTLHVENWRTDQIDILYGMPNLEADTLLITGTLAWVDQP